MMIGMHGGALRAPPPTATPALCWPESCLRWPESRPASSGNTCATLACEPLLVCAGLRACCNATPCSILPTLAHVTLAWGTEDEFYPLSKWQVHELLEFSSTEAVLLPGKHAPHFETPGVQAVADFINGIIDPQPATACNARGADLRHDTPKPDVIVAGLHTFLLLVAVLTLAAVGQVTVRFAKSCLTARLSFPTTGAQGRGGAFLM